MKIFRTSWEAGRWRPGATVAIGKFDGLHRGHRGLIEAARSDARARKAACMVLTFDPLPQQLFATRFQPLLPLPLKLDMMRALGVDAVVLLRFDEDLACQAPEAFAATVLSDALKAASIFVGEGFCFGKDRSGTTDTLAALGASLGFRSRSVPLVCHEGRAITTSRIRELITAGDTTEAEACLGWKLSRLRRG